MKFTEYLKEQVILHPSIMPRDVVKMCYQAAFGAEHLLLNREAAKRYLRAEYEQIRPCDELLYEKICDTVCRVNIGAWKKRQLPLEWLFQMFMDTASCPPSDGQEVFAQCIEEAEQLLEKGVFGFDKGCWQNFFAKYSMEQPQAVHHSEAYRNAEHPAYRLVYSRFIRIFPILEAISRKQESGVCVVAIDGRCASGKTTLAGMLAKVTGAGIIHMDDFFLPPSLRTAERLKEPGGNVDYERVLQEVIPMLQSAEAFSYGRFDCSKMAIGEERIVPAGNLRIVEGAYSCHPKFGDYMNLRIFSDVESAEQLHRIELRDGIEELVNYKERWIPMEEAYIAAYDVNQKADLII